MLNDISDTRVIFDMLIVRFRFENCESSEDLRFIISYYLAVLVNVNLFQHF